jgi:hypothetical protein
LLTSAQTNLATGKKQFFELSFGASATDPALALSPKIVFASLDLRNPFSVKRLKGTATSNYQLSYLPNGPGSGALVWEIRVRIGRGDHVDGIELRKTIAAPY